MKGRRKREGEFIKIKEMEMILWLFVDIDVYGGRSDY